MNKYTVNELKERLSQHRLPTTGTKAELVQRLAAACPDEDVMDVRSDGENIEEASIAKEEITFLRREIELLRRKNALAARELTVA